MSRKTYEPAYRRVLEQAWDGVTRLSYQGFLFALDHHRKRLSRSRRVRLPNPSRATYSRVWRRFCQDHRLNRPHPSHVRKVLLQGLSEGAWNGRAPSKELLPTVQRYLASQGMVPPAPTVLLRYLHSTRVLARRRSRVERTEVLSRFVGTTLAHLPLAQRFQAANNFPRFPPATRGKPSLVRFVEEDRWRKEIEVILEENHLPLERLLAHPDRQELALFLDRQATSTLRRRDRQLVIQALPFYLASRWQEALDMVLSIFVRRARLAWTRVQNRHAEERNETSRAFFEEQGAELAPLRRTVLSVLSGDPPILLRKFRSLLKRMQVQGEAIRSTEGFYALLARRGSTTRKLGRRLVGISFEGGDAHARAIVAALTELFRFRPLKEAVPRTVGRPLSFLAVGDLQLADRRIFEGVVLTTLADMLASGRITSPLSRGYGNRWQKVGPTSEEVVPGGPTHLVEEARRELRATWEFFQRESPGSPWVVGGHLVSRRPSRKTQEEELKARERARRRLLTRVVREVSVMSLLWEVHRSTGMLEPFCFPSDAHHRLSEPERLGRVISVIAGRGMNVGLIRMASSRPHRGFTVGQLVSLDEGYVDAGTLRKALAILMRVWEERGLGRAWGTGEKCAADGRTILTTESTLLAGYHPRHKRVGVTLYWVIRDDWMAAKVGVIGSHDFEAWYLLDALLAPDGGQSPHWAAGDTHGQQLAVWGLAYLLGFEVRARFRSLGRVKLYHEHRIGSLPVDGVESIRWSLIEESLPSLSRLVHAIRMGRLTAEEALRRWHVYDERGKNVAEALRELGKVVRTTYVLRYAMSEELRREVQGMCNKAETWNDFEAAISWGHVGRMRVVDPRRREVNALCKELLMNSIVFYNAEKYGQEIRKVRGATPVMWEHVLLFEPYRLPSRQSAAGKSRPI